VRVLHGLWKSLESADRLVESRKRQRLSSEQALHYLNRFFEAFDSDAGGVKGHAYLFVLLRRPSSANTDLRPPAREHIQSSEFLRDDS
jgi:hypothetical protein